MDTLNGNMRRELAKCNEEFERTGEIDAAWASHAHKIRLKLVELGYLAWHENKGSFFLAKMTAKGYTALTSQEK